MAGLLEFPLRIAVEVNGQFVLLGPENLDQKLDEGGPNEVTAAQLKQLVDLLGTLELTTNKNQAGGYAGIGGDGKILSNLIPALAIGSTYVRASEAEMLDLRDDQNDPIAVQEGDVCKRTDIGKTFILQSGDGSSLADWVDISSNAGGITSVNGYPGPVIVINADDIDETALRHWVSPAEKATWNGKQDPISTDTQPTLNSPNFLTSGAIYAALADKSASIEVKLFDGTDLDGDKRLNLDPEDKDINIVQFLSINGLIQKPGTDYTVDGNHRYVELSTAKHNTADDKFVLVYFSDVPILSLNQVEVNNVNGLLTDGKISDNYLPEDLGGRSPKPFDPDLFFHLNFAMSHEVGGPINFTFNAGTEEDKTEPEMAKSTVIFLKADGVNAPTFSADFYIHGLNYLNTQNKWNRLYFEYQPSGKILVDIKPDP